MQLRPRRTQQGNKSSKGMRLFRAELARRGWTIADATRELELSSGVATRLWHGDRRPSLVAAAELERRLRIPVASWAAPCSASR